MAKSCKTCSLLHWNGAAEVESPALARSCKAGASTNASSKHLIQLPLLINLVRAMHLKEGTDAKSVSIQAFPIVSIFVPHYLTVSYSRVIMSSAKQHSVIKLRETRAWGAQARCTPRANLLANTKGCVWKSMVCI
eukprot:1146218-Pelagomonas_calceolata.AAC.5